MYIQEEYYRIYRTRRFSSSISTLRFNWNELVKRPEGALNALHNPACARLFYYAKKKKRKEKMSMLSLDLLKKKS